MLTKKELRQQALQQRQALTVWQVQSLGAQVIQRLTQEIPWQKFHCVHIYLSCDQRKEINTRPLMDYLWQTQTDTTIVTNRIDPERDQMDCYVINANTQLEKNRFNILEPVVTSIEKIDPQKIDLMILPLLASDERGVRLGYGRGYYDQLLARCTKSMRRVGINYFSPLTIHIPHEPHDEPLHRLVTVENIYQF